VSNLEKAKKLESKSASKRISGGLVEPFKFTSQQKKELENILKSQCSSEVISQTEKIIESKLVNDDVPKINRASETKKSLELATGHLLNAMKYLNELDPMTAESLPEHIYLAARNEDEQTDQKIASESPMRNLRQMIAGIEKYSEMLPSYSTNDELRYFIGEVARAFKKHNLKPSYSRESKFHRFLIVSLAAIDIIKKDISDIIKERLKQG
tara:strand:+ start:2772 stop:3404 length:633 start_codon:yes stop_codon:yes gene_type:complete